MAGKRPLSLGSNVSHEEPDGWSSGYGCPRTSDAAAMPEVACASVDVDECFIFRQGSRRKAGKYAPLQMTIVTIKDLLDGGDSVVDLLVRHGGWLSAWAAECLDAACANLETHLMSEQE